MHWFWSYERAHGRVAAVVCLVLFVVALIGGLGLKSFVVLAAAAFWVVKARFAGERARAAHRHRELRRRRHERMREGTWSGPHRDD